MIKVVVLDLDGVYFLNSHENFKKNLGKQFSLTEKQIVAVYFKSQKMQEYKKGKTTGDQFWSWAIKEWGINATKDEILEILASSYEINPEAQNLIKKLNAHGIKLALCSNNFPERIKAVDEKLDFLKNFDIQVFSYEEGATKPSREIFNTLIKKSQVAPSEIVYFDDSAEAISTAKQLGINAFLYTSFDEMVTQINRLINK